eukprot:4655081-Pyramimonas_sp.AAC.2
MRQKSLRCKRFLSGASEAANMGPGTRWFILDAKLHGVSVATGVVYLVRSTGATGEDFVGLG